MQNRITDGLALDEYMIWTLDFTENSCVKIYIEIQNAHIISQKSQLMHGDEVGMGNKMVEWGKLRGRDMRGRKGTGMGLVGVVEIGMMRIPAQVSRCDN